MAAAALRGLAQRALGVEFSPARLSLARTALALLDAPRPEQPTSDLTGAADPARHLAGFGKLRLVSPPGALDGAPLRWRHGPPRFGEDAPTWR